MYICCTVELYEIKYVYTKIILISNTQHNSVFYFHAVLYQVLANFPSHYFVLYFPDLPAREFSGGERGFACRCRHLFLPYMFYFQCHH